MLAPVALAVSVVSDMSLGAWAFFCKYHQPGHIRAKELIKFDRLSDE
jgi:hypothetical protein